jgi:hypothetical protein
MDLVSSEYDRGLLLHTGFIRTPQNIWGKDKKSLSGSNKSDVGRFPCAGANLNPSSPSNNVS